MVVNPSPVAIAALVDVAADVAERVAGVRTGPATPLAKAVLGGLVRSERARLLDPAAMKRLGRSAGVARGRTRRAAVAGYAPAQPGPAKPSPGATKATAAAKSSSPLSFLSDPRLSVEEKLMRLLAYLNDKYEKDIQAKMDELAGKAPKATSGSSAKKKGGILGALGSAVVSAIGGDAVKGLSGLLKLPGVKAALAQMSGPALAAAATALGFPAAAPLLLKYGSKAVDAAAGVLDAAAASSTGASGASGASTSGASGKNEQLAMMEIQRLMEKQKEMFSLVSNVLRAGHDTRMTAINNIR